eukprot:CAMPEP_0184754104 /NCGR_PEP_ID=MMETSP0315-20130426/44447_1 /TAXON_ID=101924 /ORGANISM="Rhodosorus marinus, Strain UTEX LB 2760" /LENGTH=480 /DNA_ID=CAMNT_0027233507 /DNA_START=199 /DNA_END=1641 /DNA_ORIENTATION=-
MGRLGFVGGVGFGVTVSSSGNLCARRVWRSSEQPLDEKAVKPGVDVEPSGATSYSIVNAWREAPLVPIVDVDGRSELITNFFEKAWGTVNQQLADGMSDEEMSSLRSTFARVVDFERSGLLSVDYNTKIAKLAGILSILGNLNADLETLQGAMVYSSVQDSANMEAEIDSLAAKESVQTIVDDALWLDALPSSLEHLDDDNAKILREYVIEAAEEPRAVLVKLAEVLNTMRNVQQLRMYEQHIRALECLQVFVPLAHAMGVGKLMWDLEDISFRVLFPESYAAVEEWHSLMGSRCEATLESSARTLRGKLMRSGLLKEYTVGFDVSGRTKNLFSTFKKVLKGNKKREEVLDIVGMRVILNVEEKYRHNKEICRKACLEVHRIISGEWPQMEGRLKDYILNPKPNGYQSIHTTVIASGGLPLEVQIRTQDMHNAAEYGNAGHQFYKGGLKSVDEVQRFADNLRNENMAMLQLPAAREVVTP